MLKPRILIVDDIFANCLLLAMIAKELDCSHALAKDGQEAVGCLNKKDYDIVLMDIEMPRMNGIETTRYIREELKMDQQKLPIIALTAHNVEDYKQDMATAGFNEVLTKPYMASKISDLLDKYCK